VTSRGPWPTAAALRPTAAAVLILLTSFLTASAPPVRAEVVKIKLATLAPEGSSWHELLKDLQADWTKASGGRVELRVFAGGVAGDEPVVMKKMGINNYQAALISSHGLGTIDKSTRVFTVPRMLRTNEELDHALEVMAPELERRLDEKGYVVLFWADAGWIKFFTQSSDASVEGVKKHKLFSWAGDAEGLELWRKAGFNVVPLPATELLTSLQTKMVNAFDSMPYYALASQAYRHTGYMIDMNWAPLPGALVMTKTAWSKIPADLQPVLKEISAKYAERFRTETRRMDAEAVTAMKERGLKVIVPTPEVVAEWDKASENAYPDFRGYYVTEQDFDWLYGIVKQMRGGAK
jgi:TRAP-type C4-dicarboxylate transport system substrate-binding protein